MTYDTTIDKHRRPRRAWRLSLDPSRISITALLSAAFLILGPLRLQLLVQHLQRDPVIQGLIQQDVAKIICADNSLLLDVFGVVLSVGVDFKSGHFLVSTVR